MKGIKFGLVLLIVIFSSFSFGSTDFSCPTHIDILKPLDSLSNEWVTYKHPRYRPSKNSAVKNGDLLGIDLTIGKHQPFEPLGSTIPNNEHTGFEDGFWLWKLEGQQSPEWDVNIDCYFQGTDIVLVNVVKVPLKECKNPIKDGRGINLIKCI